MDRCIHYAIMSSEKPPQEVPVLTGAESDKITTRQPYPEQTDSKHEEPYEEELDIERQTTSRGHNSIDDTSSQRPKLEPIRSHVSTHDAPGATNDDHYEEGDEVYSKFTPNRKIVIVSVLSFCSFLAPISSTSILSASPEVVATFHTTGALFNLSNALYMLFMGLSPLVYGPLGTTYGRRWPLIIASITFTLFSIGSALSPNLACYYIMRMLTAFQGTAFLIIGGTVIGDIYRPIERGTAYGFFLSGTLIGPALGPLIAGVIVTYVSWRNIFWLQVALAGVATIAVILLIPETIHRARKEELVGLTRKEKARKLWSWGNPVRVLWLFRYPNLAIVGVASSALVWNMYSLLTPIRYVLNPRFELTTPLQSGLFYIAPGCGYLTGTFFGGRWADHVVKKWIRKRGGQRVPEDRLRSCLVALGVVIPACMLLYGWSIEKEVGGIPLPVIVMYIQGVAQLFCFPSLNTYCLVSKREPLSKRKEIESCPSTPHTDFRTSQDVMKKQSSEVVAGNYVIRYLFAAGGSAACLPVIEAIGVGWFSTISAFFLVLAAVGTWATSVWGHEWQESMERRWPSEA
jgi:multidrug resistance protein